MSDDTEKTTKALKHMRDTADMAFTALHHLAGDLHSDREDDLTRMALQAASMANDLYSTLGFRIADRED